MFQGPKRRPNEQQIYGRQYLDPDTDGKIKRQTSETHLIDVPEVSQRALIFVGT